MRTTTGSGIGEASLPRPSLRGRIRQPHIGPREFHLPMASDLSRFIFLGEERSTSREARVGSLCETGADGEREGLERTVEGFTAALDGSGFDWCRLAYSPKTHHDALA
jgi:hypothetical protein